MTTTFALECSAHFFCGQQTEPYQEYGEEEAQQKNVLSAENGLQGRTCFGLERRGA